MPDTQVGRIEQLTRETDSLKREIVGRSEITANLQRDYEQALRRIALLEARERELLEALQPLAVIAEDLGDALPDHACPGDGTPFLDISVGDIRRAHRLAKPAEKLATPQGGKE